MYTTNYTTQNRLKNTSWFATPSHLPCLSIAHYYVSAYTTTKPDPTPCTTKFSLRVLAIFRHTKDKKNRLWAAIKTNWINFVIAESTGSNNYVHAYMTKSFTNSSNQNDKSQTCKQKITTAYYGENVTTNMLEYTMTPKKYKYSLLFSLAHILPSFSLQPRAL